MRNVETQVRDSLFRSVYRNLVDAFGNDDVAIEALSSTRNGMTYEVIDFITASLAEFIGIENFEGYLV